MSKLTDKKKEVMETIMKDAVFEATCQVIRERGWPALTMERVAEKAGVSKGTVYNYFKDKKELVWLVMTRLGLRIESRIREIMEKENSSTEALKEIIRIELLNRRENAHMGAAFAQAISSEPEIRERFQSDDHPFYKVKILLRNLFEEGMKKGEFRQTDSLFMEMILTSIFHGITRGWAFGMLSQAPEELSELVISLFEDGFILRKETCR